MLPFVGASIQLVLLLASLDLRRVPTESVHAMGMSSSGSDSGSMTSEWYLTTLNCEQTEILKPLDLDQIYPN